MLKTSKQMSISNLKKILLKKGFNVSKQKKKNFDKYKNKL